MTIGRLLPNPREAACSMQDARASSVLCLMYASLDLHRTPAADRGPALERVEDWRWLVAEHTVGVRPRGVTV